MMPLVSVGIPTYNNPEMLRAVLDCITGQTYRNLQIVVSDNNSPNPESRRVIQEFADKDNRIVPYFQPQDMRMEDHHIFVRDMSRGKYFMWAMDDDWWSKTYIENLVLALEENPGIPLAACPSMYVSRTGEQSPIRPLNNLSVFNAVGNGDHGLACMGLWRMDDVKKYEVTFPPNMVLGIDHIQVATVIMACGKVLVIDTELFRKGYTPGKFQNCFKYEPFYAINSWWFMIKVLARSPHIPATRKLLLPLVAITNFARACAITGVQVVISMPDNPVKSKIQKRFFGAN